MARRAHRLWTGLLKGNRQAPPGYHKFGMGMRARRLEPTKARTKWRRMPRLSSPHVPYTSTDTDTSAYERETGPHRNQPCLPQGRHPCPILRQTTILRRTRTNNEERPQPRGRTTQLPTPPYQHPPHHTQGQTELPRRVRSTDDAPT